MATAAVSGPPLEHPNITSPDTPGFPTSVLHQPVSQPVSQQVSRRVSKDGSSYSVALPTSPAALPNSPTTPGYALTVNPANKPPSPTNPSNSIQADAVHSNQSISSFRQQMQQQALANSGLETKSRGPAIDSEWNPKHPCFPHPNVHVPITSPFFDATRIIRISRDWMEAGDLYPVFSETYPEILLPHISEQSFRGLITDVNAALKDAYEPASTSAIIDGVLGALTGWVLEDSGLIGPKRRIKQVEAVIERWNNDRLNERNNGERYGADAETDDFVMVVPLRRTAYMSLDIQIPDPKLNFEEVVSEVSPSIHSAHGPNVATGDEFGSS